MREYNIKDEYKLKGIGENTRIYRYLIDRFKDVDEDILLNFIGYNVSEPWLNLDFVELMSNEHIYIRVSGDEAFARNVEVTLKLIGCKNIHRVESVYKTEIKYDPAKERRVNNFKEMFSKTFSVNGNKLEVKVRNSGLTQVSNDDTLGILGDCIKEYCNSNPNIKEVEIDSTGVILGKSRVAAVAELLNSSYFVDNNIETFIKDDYDTDLVDKIKAHRLIKAGEVLSVDKRISILKNYGIKEGTVVMLSIFKITKGKNEFGQMNDGVPAISRIAVFKGYKKERGSEAILSFRSYKKNTFRTREDYCLDNDFNDDITEMSYQDYNFKVSEIGFMDKFTGSRAHFNLPIQFDMSGYMYSYVKLDNGSITSCKYNLPAYTKHVFDSWGIKYNEDSLDFCIKESDRILKELEEKENK